MPTPFAQELTEQISFIQAVPPFSVLGELGVEESVFATVWARIRELGGEIEPGDQQHIIQKQQYEIWTQYLAGVNGFMQVRWGNRRLTITGIPQKIMDRFGRHWTMLTASESTERSF